MQIKKRSFKAAISIGTLCACAGAALAAPPNDLCANAQVITAPASVAGTNVAANTDGPAGACASSATDVWYRYTHPVNGTTQGLTITTCSGASFDTLIRVFTGTCGALTQTQCNDDSCGLQSSVTQTVTPGTTYYIAVSGFGGATGTFTLDAAIAAPPPPPTTGPDVIVGDVSDASYWGTVGNIAAFSLGTTSCNIGDSNISWIANTNQHPVIGQNMYKIENNRMELIGISWLKHGFTALTQNLCATCSGQGGAVLGVGCSDPYVSSLNGDQSRLGPRSHVNATTGFYPYPFSTPGGTYMVPPAAAATIGRRLQVVNTELNHAGATYVGECQYINADDASFIDTQAGPFQNKAHNGLNNVSYRRMTAPVAAAPAMQGATARTQPAIMAWQALDPTVVVNSYDYMDGTTVCRFWVGAKVVDNANGTWTYNYIIMNVNSDRSGASFSVPLSNVTVTSPFNRIPTYHSGEFASMNAAWITTVGSTEVNWATPQTFAQNANSSALRWSTAATFAFTANTAPTTGTATLGLFKPGTAGPVSMTNLPVPSAGAPGCAANFNHDTAVDLFDYLDFVAAFSAGSQSADFDGDGTVDFADYLDFVAAFSAGC